jgi:hypothetical protein
VDAISVLPKIYPKYDKLGFDSDATKHVSTDYVNRQQKVQDELVIIISALPVLLTDAPDKTDITHASLKKMSILFEDIDGMALANFTTEPTLAQAVANFKEVLCLFKGAIRVSLRAAVQRCFKEELGNDVLSFAGALFLNHAAGLSMQIFEQIASSMGSSVIGSRSDMLSRSYFGLRKLLGGDLHVELSEEAIPEDVACDLAASSVWLSNFLCATRMSLDPAGQDANDFYTQSINSLLKLEMAWQSTKNDAMKVALSLSDAAIDACVALVDQAVQETRARVIKEVTFI